jgi:phosphoribosylformylglycinamidine synthase
MKKINFGVVVFPGTNCDKDTFWVLDKVFHQNVRAVWHTESDLEGLDVLVLPGGFSYGDYLRSGAIARFSPVMKALVKHAQKGKAVLGICNGFQILAEAGLIKGAFLRNKGVHFLCREQNIKALNKNSIFTNQYQKDEVAQVPIAHGEGNYFLNQDDLKYTLDNELIAFQYCDENGLADESSNPNGSTYHIAGVFNKEKNVLGIMPHPERASEAEMGSIGGKKVFESIMARI